MSSTHVGRHQYDVVQYVRECMYTHMYVHTHMHNTNMHSLGVSDLLWVCLLQVLELPKETFITALHWYPSQTGGARKSGALEICALGTTNGRRGGGEGRGGEGRGGGGEGRGWRGRGGEGKKEGRGGEGGKGLEGRGAERKEGSRGERREGGEGLEGRGGCRAVPQWYITALWMNRHILKLLSAVWCKVYE